MTEKIFDAVVDGLEFVADTTNLSYKQINVYGMLGWIGLTAYLTYKAYKK
ncbi:MAG: hypothetical protein U5K00_00510 [Melioribacteraceae bacterium]|nr:hypothetical protein [Melioribacteraceae bacterium]